MLKNDIAALAPMPDDPILGLVSLYQADERPNKVNLGVGVYLNAPAHCSSAPRLRISSWASRNPSYRIRPGAITLRFSRLTVSLSASIRTFRLTARQWILMP